MKVETHKFVEGWPWYPMNTCPSSTHMCVFVKHAIEGVTGRARDCTSKQTFNIRGHKCCLRHLQSPNDTKVIRVEPGPFYKDFVANAKRDVFILNTITVQQSLGLTNVEVSSPRSLFPVSVPTWWLSTEDYRENAQAVTRTQVVTLCISETISELVFRIVSGQ